MRRFVVNRFLALVATLLLASSAQVDASAPGDNAELVKLFTEDQGDRTPPDGKLTAEVDWAAVVPRDRAREKRVKELIAGDALKSGADYYHAAMVLQHAQAPDDFLLAHDLCVVAITKGEERAKWLAAASLDRFLTNIGRAQRFGTQFRSKDMEHPVTLMETDPSVPDSLRRALNVPTLAQAKQREIQLAREFEESRKVKTSPAPR
jgi:hypothetical protein